MLDYSVGLAISVGAVGYGVLVFLFETVKYVGITNVFEAKIDNIKNDENIVGWDDVMGARIHINILRHKLRYHQLSIVCNARNNGLPPIVVGLLLAMWFVSKT